MLGNQGLLAISRGKNHLAKELGEGWAGRVGKLSSYKMCESDEVRGARNAETEIVCFIQRGC